MYFNEFEFYFPKDLQLSTWRFLSPIELCCVSRVCKSFNQTSSLDELWIHFVHPSKEITKDYKNYFLQKMRQSWENFLILKYLPFDISQQIFDENICSKAKSYQTKYCKLFRSYLGTREELRSEPRRQAADYWFKLLLRGDPGVGKTSLLLRFTEKMFTDSSIGVDFKIKTMNIGNKIIKLQIWDNSGYSKFRPINSSAYRGAKGIIIVADPTDPDSLINMEQWKQEVLRYAHEGVSITYCLNKSDLKELSPEEIEKYILENEKWIKTSAKTGENVDEMFETMVKGIVAKSTGLILDIRWNFHSSGNLHTVIPNLDSYLEKLENSLKDPSLQFCEDKPKDSSCQIQ